MSEQVVICEPVRTPIGRYGGALKAPRAWATSRSTRPRCAGASAWRGGRRGRRAPPRRRVAWGAGEAAAGAGPAGPGGHGHGRQRERVEG